jgi:hypothetical protein
MQIAAGIHCKRESDTRIFTSGFFHEAVSPGPLGIPLGAISKFYKNSQRHSKVKVDHRFRCYLRLIIAGVADAGDKLIASIMEAIKV